MSADRIGDECPACGEHTLRESYGTWLEAHPQDVRVITNYFGVCRSCDWELHLDDVEIGRSKLERHIINE